MQVPRRFVAALFVLVLALAGCTTSSHGWQTCGCGSDALSTPTSSLPR